MGASEAAGGERPSPENALAGQGFTPRGPTRIPGMEAAQPPPRARRTAGWYGGADERDGDRHRRRGFALRVASPAASLALSTIGGVGIWSMVVVLPDVQAEFGVARGAASVPYTATMLGWAAGGAPMGKVADRFGVVAAHPARHRFARRRLRALRHRDRLRPVRAGAGGADRHVRQLGDLQPAGRRRLALVRAARGTASASSPAAATSPARSGRRSSARLVEQHGWRPTFLGIAAFCLATMAAARLRAAPPDAARGRGAAARRRGRPPSRARRPPIR